MAIKKPLLALEAGKSLSIPHLGRLTFGTMLRLRSESYIVCFTR